MARWGLRAIVMGAALGLAAVAWAPPFGAPPAPPEPASAPAPARGPAVSPESFFTEMAPPPLEALGETRARPLFSPSRRPPATPAPATPLEDATRHLILGRYARTGVVISGARRVLTLRDVQTGEAVRLGVGDALDDWRLVALTFERIVLERDGEARAYAADPPQ